jgi:hypothetical protein
LLLPATVVATILTAALGWLLAEGGGYDAGLLGWHRWTGIGVAVLTIALWLMHLARQQRAYRILLGATLALTLVAGHHGGSLTHGRGFLTQHAPWKLARSSSGPTALQSFAQAQSVLEHYCVSCHGPEKAKGGLRLDSMDAMLAGGDSGPALVAGDAERSLILQRMLLPPAHEEHMPPEGKPQPMPGEVWRVKAWIAAGAPR